MSEHIHPQCRPQVFDFDDAIEVVDGTADLDGVPEGATLGLPSSLDEASEGVAGIHPVPNGDVQDDIASLHEETEGAHDDHPPTVTNNGRPTRNVGTSKDGPANIRKFPIDEEDYEFSFSAQHISDQPIPMIAR